LDKTTSAERAKALALRFIGKESASWDEIRKYISDKYQELIGTIDKTLESRWVWGNTRSNLQVFKGLIMADESNCLNIIDTLEFIEELSKAVSLLGEQQEKYQTKSKELEEVLSRLQKMWAEPRIAKVASIMEQIEQQIEAGKKAGDAYRV
jgi:hypothetical protein